jgi:hypothetical protein
VIIYFGGEKNMSKNIVFGSLLTVFILLMIPVLPAMEYQHTNQPDSICNRCQYLDPLCLSDLVEFIWYMSLFVILLCTIIFIPYALDAFVYARITLAHAKAIDCLWAKILPNPFPISLYPISELI